MAVLIMLETNHLILRDFKEEDIKKRIQWETVETEWKLWDGPWEYESMTEQEEEESLNAYIENMKKWVENYKVKSDKDRRYTFQIEEKSAENNYIGWASSYCITKDYSYTDDTTEKWAIGIDFPDRSARGKGYAYEALCAFIAYMKEQGESELYTQTWSGNVRMIHIAEKIGFVECCRKIDFRTVRGKKYDGLTFKLDDEKYREYLSKLNQDIDFHTETDYIKARLPRFSLAEEGISKPDLRIFQLALEKAQCNSEEVIMIGDRIDNDIIPAKKIGMYTIWVKQGMGRL